MGIFTDDYGRLRTWAFFTVLCGSVVAVIFLLLLLTRPAEIDMLECRKQGLDAVPRPFPSLHMDCVPRAGHGIDTVYIKSGE